MSTAPGVPQCEQAGCSEKRRRVPLSSATATPSPSLNAVATASARRLRLSASRAGDPPPPGLPCASRTSRSASGSSSRTIAPSSWARTNPAARSWAATSTSGRWADARQREGDDHGLRVLPRSRSHAQQCRPPPPGRCRSSHCPQVRRSRAFRRAPTGAAENRRSRWRCRRWSGWWWWDSSARSPPPGRCPRGDPPAAWASARGTAWRRWTATRCSAAGPRHRAYRRPASSCRRPRAGDDRQRPPGSSTVIPLQIVLARIADDDAVGRRGHNLGNITRPVSGTGCRGPWRLPRHLAPVVCAPCPSL